MSARTWLTPAEVARLLRVTPMTVYRMVKDGEMPAIRFGSKNKGARENRTIRIPAAALAEFLAAHWVGEVPDGYRLEDLLGKEQDDGDVVQLPSQEADR